jgi:putative glutamine amidotransferase
MKPIIGITFSDNIENDPDNNYIRAIKEHGGIPHILYPRVSVSECDSINGLLLTGGGDIHPQYFDQEWHPSLKYVSEDRDELELPLCQEAIERDLPVFGICRGIQIMGVAMGGSLYQDVPSQFTDPLTHPAKSYTEDSEHKIEIVPNSRLSELVKKNADEVNSAHHQAVDEIGEGFVVTARSADGIVEAIENPSKKFVLGVQYHPERMTETDEFLEHRRKLFEAFIQAAADSKPLRG